MSHLFSGWPRESLAQIHSDRSINPNGEICARYYQLSDRITANPADWWRRTVDYVGGRADSLDGIASVRITPRLERWLKEFQPQIVFSQMGGLWLTRLTNMVVKTLQIPLVVHVSDDWISDWPVNGLERRNVFPIAQVLNYLCRLEFVNAIKAARLRYCISQAMCTQYQARYGFEFSALHNGINPQQWSEKGIEPKRAGEPFRIFYSGSISENGNLQSLKDVSEAVAGLAEQGVPIRMEVATHTTGFSFRPLIERPPHVTFCELVPYADLPRRLQEFDLLLIALNFDDVSSRWLRYSMLGKVAEYMISGTPVLLYGPQTNASIAYAVSEDWGYAVTDRGQLSIQAALQRLIADDGLRMSLASNARRIALRDHDITSMRGDFQSAVCEAAFS